MWLCGIARIRTPLLPQSIDICCQQGPQQQTCSSGTDRRTDTAYYASSANKDKVKQT